MQPTFMSTRPVTSGFTLLEVLVAFAIAGLTLAAVLPLFGTSLRASAVVERRTAALLIAESKLAEVGATVPLRTGRSDGT